ncbi:MAG: M48 family metalloprotease [Rhodovarius sp.]|nr:M48 family metalloprotease [Rhodovarius sp.]
MARLLLDPGSLARQLRLNRLESALLLTGLSGLAGLVGLLVAGFEGLISAALAALLLLIVFPAPGGALFRHALGGIPLPEAAAPALHALARQLAARAGLGPPELYLLPMRELQAMAAGDAERPAIALTQGLLAALPPREVAAVIAHELAHVRHGDLQVMRLAAAAASLTRAMSMLGLISLALLLPAGIFAAPAPPWALLLLLLAPTLGDLLSLSLSRRREYLADAGAVELTGDPAGLAQALARLERLQGDDWERLAARGGPRWLRLFRTHPTIRERIARLAETVVVAPAPPPEAWRIAIAAPPRRFPHRLAQRWWL